jgi:class 3 adenylate cyclase/tetratricopeptide (TPR) repeat protein
MTCSRCQHENPPASNFCLGCGARLGASCGACGNDLPAGSRFCNKCGAPVSDESAGAARGASAESYTPKHLADKILTSKSALEGERKQVTVLFVDIAESTRLAERLDPEGMHELLDRALRLMAEAVHRYEGTVNQFLGDGLMALFGAPVALEDHALRAAEAAFAIQETIRGLSEQLRRERGAEVRVRVGLNTGLVVVGKIGDDLRMDYTAVGDTTHIAARMQALAEPGTILIAEATHRLLEGYVRSEPLGPLEVKGKSEPVPTFRLVSRRRRTRLEAHAERGLTELVGRRRELEILQDRLDQARSGRGQVVGIVGEPGAGKSRLVYEFRRTFAGERVTMLTGDCVASGQMTPYLPVIDVLKSSFHIDDGDNPLQVEEKLRRGVHQLDPALESVLLSLRDLFPLRANEPTGGGDPRSKRQKTFEAIRALTMAASQRRPQMIVIEDLHWIDQTSEDYLAFFVDSLANIPVLLVTTCRPGYAVRWADRTWFTGIALDLLTENGTAAMLAARFGVSDLPPSLAALVHQKAEGNPLFVEEIAGSLLERGAIVRRNGGLAWSGAGIVDVPATGQDIIRARIDQLEEPVKRTTQIASVIGREFSLTLLREVAEQPLEVERHLDRLKRLELVYETRFFPEVVYAFKHALIQDVAYQTLLVRRRRELHAATGRALEALHGDRAADHAEVLARHFSAGDERAKALEYLTIAGDRAAAVFADREAAALYERALPLIGEDDLARRAACLHKLALATFYDNIDATVRYGKSALELHERLGDRRNAMAMHAHVATTYMAGWDAAREDSALGHLEAAAAIAAEDPDSVEKGLVYQRIGHLYLHRGEPAIAFAWAQRAVGVFDRLEVTMGTCIGTATAYQGRLYEGIGYNESNWERVVEAGNPLIIGVLAHELLVTLALARDVPRAKAYGKRALAAILRALAAQKQPAEHFQNLVRLPLTLVYGLSGEAEPAREEAEIVERIEARTLSTCRWEDAAAVGFTLLRRGKVEAARASLERTLARMTERNQIAAISGCSFVLGLLAKDEDRLDDAEALLHRSLEIARNGGSVLFELWVLPALCEVLIATGNLEGAQAFVERALLLLDAGLHWYGLPAGIHLARGLLARERRDWDEAEAAFVEAVAVNRRYALPWDEAKTLYEWARMYQRRDRIGDREQAGSKAAAACDLFERVGAIRDAQKTLAADL